jgi:hypothetical protein
MRRKPEGVVRLTVVTTARCYEFFAIDEVVIVPGARAVVQEKPLSDTGVAAVILANVPEPSSQTTCSTSGAGSADNAVGGGAAASSPCERVSSTERVVVVIIAAALQCVDVS